MNVTTIPRTTASAQFNDTELKGMFESCRQQYGGDFGLMVVAMFLEVSEICAELKSRLAALEGKKR
jgi:hypothetical protein